MAARRRAILTIPAMASWSRLEDPPSFRDGALAPDPESRDSGSDASHRPGMTKNEDANAKTTKSARNCPRPMPVRQRRLRDRCAGALGLARSFDRQPSRAWRGLRHLCRKLAQAFSHYQRRGVDCPLRRQGRESHPQLLQALWHAADVRTGALAAHGEHSARAFCRPNRPPDALSCRDRRAAGVDLCRRAAGAAEGFSRRGLAAFEKEATRRSRRDVLIAQGSHERASLHHAFKFDHDATTATATVRGQEET